MRWNTHPFGMTSFDLALQTAADTGWALYELPHRHTLRTDATTFHLEAGRLCVLASRRRHACIVVARAGIPELLDAHPSAEPVHLGVAVKFPVTPAAHGVRFSEEPP